MTQRVVRRRKTQELSEVQSEIVGEGKRRREEKCRQI